MKVTIDRKPVQLSKVLQAAADGSFPTEIEIARAGEWHTPWHGDFVITVEDIDEAIAQFEAGVYRVQKTEPLPITLDHLGGESPAAGRITRVFRRDEVFLASVTWTELGKEKLSRDEYRYVSFEYNPRSMPFENPENAGDIWVNVLTGATLTNDPLFKKLKPVMASARGGSDNSNERTQMNIDEIRKKQLKDLTEEEKKFLEEHKTDLTADERASFELETDEEKQAREKAEADAKAQAEKEAADKADADRKAAEEAERQKLEASTKGMNPEQKEAFKSLQASVAALTAKAEAGERAEKQLLDTQLRASVTAHIERGAIKSSELESTVTMLAASSEEARKAQLTFMENLPSNTLLAKEFGKTGVEASVQTLTAEEKNMAEQFNLTEEQVLDYKKAEAAKQ